MSLPAMTWAIYQAPVENAAEWAVLVVMADVADDYGRGSHLAVETIAVRTRLGESTVRKHRATLIERGLLVRSDDLPPSLMAIPADKRPACFNLDLSLVAGAQIERALPGGPKPKTLLLNTQEGTSNQVAAAATVSVDHRGQDLDVPQQQAQDSVTPRNQGIPWTEVQLLRAWFGIERREQVESWQAAWRTAVLQVDVGTYDPGIHLNAYLVRCHDEGRAPSPSRWLKFLIEDAVKWAADVRAHQDRLEQQAQADGGEQWALNSLSRTPKWEGKQ